MTLAAGLLGAPADAVGEPFQVGGWLDPEIVSEPAAEGVVLRDGECGTARLFEHCQHPPGGGLVVWREQEGVPRCHDGGAPIPGCFRRTRHRLGAPRRALAQPSALGRDPIVEVVAAGDVERGQQITRVASERVRRLTGVRGLLDPVDVALDPRTVDPDFFSATRDDDTLPEGAAEEGE